MREYHAGGTRVAVREGTGTGAKTAELRYLPWGKTIAVSGTTPTDYRSTGQREEAELGLYFYNAHWYDPYLTRSSEIRDR